LTQSTSLSKHPFLTTPSNSNTDAIVDPATVETYQILRERREGGEVEIVGGGGIGMFVVVVGQKLFVATLKFLFKILSVAFNCTRQTRRRVMECSTGL
jgi:hypothetical protein